MGKSGKLVEASWLLLLQQTDEAKRVAPARGGLLLPRRRGQASTSQLREPYTPKRLRLRGQQNHRRCVQFLQVQQFRRDTGFQRVTNNNYCFFQLQVSDFLNLQTLTYAIMKRQWSNVWQSRNLSTQNCVIVFTSKILTKKFKTMNMIRIKSLIEMLHHNPTQFEYYPQNFIWVLKPHTCCVFSPHGTF